MEEYQIRGIPQRSVETLWKFAEPFIKRALDHTFGELSIEDIRQACLTENMQLWMCLKGTRVIGAGTTMIVLHPQMKVCRIVTLSGAEFDQWVHQCNMHIELWAESMGCVGMEAYVRKGFVPKLIEIGFKHRYSVVHKSFK